ncbi:MAG TPA: AraC family transcriptional regulator [Candidatus Aminicenantes bacterium]|nr:AraC family transcriptional regulator [Candidatus Aminicenantes bacterium]
MEVTWFRRPAFLVMGIVRRIFGGNSVSASVEQVWRQFESHHDQVLPLSTDRSYYGVRFSVNGGEGFDYHAGMAVRKAHTTPAGLMVREIPAARYAVFRCMPHQVDSVYHAILENWLPESGETRDTEAPVFEQYPPEGASDPFVLIHFPVSD